MINSWKDKYYSNSRAVLSRNFIPKYFEKFLAWFVILKKSLEFSVILQNSRNIFKQDFNAIPQEISAVALINTHRIRRD